MKKNQRTVKVYDTTHKILAELSCKYGLSQASLVDLAVDYLASKKSITLTPSKRGQKRNSATAKRVAKVVAA